MNNILHYFSS